MFRSMSLVVLILYLSACSAKTASLNEHEPFILNGQEAKVGEFPHQLALLKKIDSVWYYWCGAVLISDIYALTTAQCVDNGQASSFRIRAGLHDVNDLTGTQTSEVQYIKKHPGWNQGPETFKNDISILTLSKKLVITDLVKPIFWNRDNNLEGQSCTLSGWGLVNKTYYPKKLQKVNMRLISNKDCDKLISSVAGAKTYPGHLCSYEPPKGFCKVDNGGPLTCTISGRTMLAGLISWNIWQGDAGSPNYPFVHTRISYFDQWIMDNTP